MFSLNTCTEIETKRLKLLACPLELAALIAGGGKGIYKKYGLQKAPNWPLNDTTEILPEYVVSLQSDPALLGWGIWLVILKESSVIIGDIGFLSKPDSKGRTELGYSIAPTYRNKGYATEAAGSLLAWAFLKDDVKKVKARCKPDNAASIKVLERVGMRPLGRKEGFFEWECTK